MLSRTAQIARNTGAAEALRGRRTTRARAAMFPVAWIHVLMGCVRIPCTLWAARGSGSSPARLKDSTKRSSISCPCGKSADEIWGCWPFMLTAESGAQRRAAPQAGAFVQLPCGEPVSERPG